MSLLKPTSLERFTGISRALRLGTACLVVMLSNWLAATTALAETPGQLPPRPNILLICVDDLRPELGCYGVEYAQAPNLDRLASQGMLFTNHFVQVPSCGQSRYALLTGRSPKSSGAMAITAMYKGKSELIQTPTEAAQTLPELFRRSGYRTVCIGKVSHTPDGKVYDTTAPETDTRRCPMPGMSWRQPTDHGNVVGARSSPTRAGGIAKTARAIRT